jgi:lathosterol oxidase
MVLPEFWPLSATLFAAIVLRYYILALIFEGLFLKEKTSGSSNYTYKTQLKKGQLAYEMIWSVITSGIFALAGAYLLLMWEKGQLPLYGDFTPSDWWYIPLSVVLALLIHETLYYWLHRWMHIPSIFKWVHKVHHQSLATTSWTAFSFHPLEGLIQMIMLAVIVLVLPLHYYVLLFLLILMSVSSIINHIGIDFYPKTGWFRKYFIGAKHHAMHHEHFTTNYGLYFTFWDRWMNTEDKEFS